MLNYLDFVVMIVGLLIYLLSGKQKPEMVGQIMFAAGLLALLLDAVAFSFHLIG